MLRLKRIHDVSNFLLAELSLERHENAGLPEVTVVFGNLVFQDQMIAKCVPGQFRDQAVVLMSVFPVVRENEVRRDCLLQIFENALISAPTNGMKPSGKLFSRGPFSRAEPANSSAARRASASRTPIALNTTQ